MSSIVTWEALSAEVSLVVRDCSVTCREVAVVAAWVSVGAAMGVWECGVGEWEMWRGWDGEKGVGARSRGRGESVVDGLRRVRRGSRGGMNAD